MTTLSTTDVVVAGAGPAGMAIAGALEARGVEVVVCDPSDGTWHQNYGAWLDDAPATLPDDVWARRWRDTRMIYDGSRAEWIGRSYGRFANPALRQALRPGGIDFRSGVDRVVHDTETSIVHLGDGTTLRARLVVDATGAGRLCARPRLHADPLRQIAYGAVIESSSHPWDPDRIVLMDWRRHDSAQRPAPPKHESGVPTFLYVLPLDERHVFVEETQLLGPDRSFDELADRLWQRLDGLGVRVDGFSDEEFCSFVMDAPLPTRRGRVIGFGAAAGFVHPVTGYSVATSLRLADPVAAAVVQALRDGRRGDALSAAAWGAVWTPERLRVRRFQDVGVAMFRRFDRRATSTFLRTFFRTPDAFWRGYLRGTDGLGTLFPAFIGRGSATPDVPLHAA